SSPSMIAVCSFDRCFALRLSYFLLNSANEALSRKAHSCLSLSVGKGLASICVRKTYNGFCLDIFVFSPQFSFCSCSLGFYLSRLPKYCFPRDFIALSLSFLP